jgi:hypothetical protein
MSPEDASANSNTSRDGTLGSMSGFPDGDRELLTRYVSEYSMFYG